MKIVAVSLLAVTALALGGCAGTPPAADQQAKAAAKPRQNVPFHAPTYGNGYTQGLPPPQFSGYLPLQPDRFLSNGSL